MPPPVFVGHDIYRRAAYGSNHPLAIPRVETATDLCHALGWLGDGEFQRSPRATEQQLSRFHCPEYVKVLKAASSPGGPRMAASLRSRFRGWRPPPTFALRSAGWATADSSGVRARPSSSCPAFTALSM